MRRGYAVVLREGRAVRSAEALVPGDALKIVLAQGKADALVTGVEKG